jgi:formamidopyrimidine-DNA glycosylase
MPELPEVEVVRHGLAPAITGATITAVRVLDERSLRRHDGPAEDFIDRLTGARIDSAVRRGKFLWMPVAVGDAAPAGETGAFGDPVEAVVVHLGMSGQVLLRGVDAEVAPLTRIVLDVAHPQHGALRVDFVDQRIFGSMAIDALRPTPDGAAGGYGSSCRARSRTSRATRSTRPSTRRGSSPPCARAARASSAPCSISRS